MHVIYSLTMACSGLTVSQEGDYSNKQLRNRPMHILACTCRVEGLQL